MWKINYYLRKKGWEWCQKNIHGNKYLINPHSRCRQPEIKNVIQSLAVPFKGLIQSNTKALNNTIDQIIKKKNKTPKKPGTSYPDIYCFMYVPKFMQFFLVCFRFVGFGFGGFFGVFLWCVFGFWSFCLFVYVLKLLWFDNKPEQNSSEQPVLVDILFQTH